MPPEQYWWAVYTTKQGHIKIRDNAELSNEEISACNAKDPNFKILYGPASNDEVTQFLNDIHPGWYRESLRRLGLEWILDAGLRNENGDEP